MGDNAGIEWTDATWSPIRARSRLTGKIGWHCIHVSPGCVNCYAERINKRLGTGLPFKPGRERDVKPFLDKTMLLAPLRWKRPRRILVNSMGDLFHESVPDAWIDRVFAVMALAPQHTFQVLTKRSARMREYFASFEARLGGVVEIIAGFYIDDPQRASWLPFDKDRAIAVGVAGWPLPNVWLGVSAEDQTRANERIPDLLATPAAVRFVSAEPLLAPIDFNALSDGAENLNALSGLRENPFGAIVTRRFGTKLDWIITGGESGPNARPMQVSWARSIVEQCRAAGTACFVKQLGANPVWEDGAFFKIRDRKGGDPTEWPEDLRVRQLPWRAASAEAADA